jgi:HD superfamily phosphohydrolase
MIKRVQDSVHGLMEFSGTERIIVKLLEAKELQRLRRVSQLGLVNLVFPGAEHSRFTHSLGASYLSIKFAKQVRENVKEKLTKYLVPNDDSIRDLAIAVLCHDLGHGPLSHAWEQHIVGKNFDRKKWIDFYKLDIENLDIEWHELITQAILNWEDGELHKTLEQNEIGSSKRISKMLLGNYYLSYLTQLISSDIDADRADYIKRDTHQTGVAYGRYDLDWLLSTCTIGVLENKLVLGFDIKKSQRVIEQFLIARKALYETVYHHKAVRAAEGMVGLFLHRLKEVVTAKGFSKKEINPNLKNMLKPIIDIISGRPLPLDELLQLDDHYISHLIQLVSKSNPEKLDDTLVDLSKRLTSRTLYRMVPDIYSKMDTTDRQQLNLIDAKLRETIASCIDAKYAPEFYYFVDKPKFKNVSSKDHPLKGQKKNIYLIKNTDMHSLGTAKNIYDEPDWHNMIVNDTKQIPRVYVIDDAYDAVKQVINTL